MILGGMMAGFTQPAQSEAATVSISSNPAAVYKNSGNGALQEFIEKKLDIKNDHGISFGGLLLGDVNYLFSGGIPNAKRWTYDSLFLFNVSVDTEKMGAWHDGLFKAEYLKVYSQEINEQAGSVLGYNSIEDISPTCRSELYQLWYRHQFFHEKLIVRIGKSVPTIDFGNVIRSIPIVLEVPIHSMSGLIYTPIFINPSQFGVLPGYYNSAYGVTLNFVPVKNWYLNYGVFDGNLARGVQTGLKISPTLNGSYFHIAETGAAWILGKNSYPGKMGIGVWHENGLVQNGSLSEHNASGLYLFGSQRLWYLNSKYDIQGISVFYQYGINNSSVLPVNKYVGAGLTVFGLSPLGFSPRRADDSMGVGVSLGWLNKRIFSRATELMFQGYYQAMITKGLYLEPALSYLPTPGASRSAAWAGTFRALLLF